MVLVRLTVYEMIVAFCFFAAELLTKDPLRLLKEGAVILTGLALYAAVKIFQGDLTIAKYEL